MNEVLLGLVLWINLNTGTGYDPQAGLPEVKQVESRALAVLFFKGQVPASLTPKDLRALTEHIEALYDHETKTIYVRNGVDLNSVYGKSTLVHELVHFIQYQDGVDKKVACTSALEKDAYRAQAAYLKQKGQQPKFDGFTVAARSACYT